mmetsp:Transcript_19683/g.57928  ORF Transcript_19683/g.57928 Transcript_19683/m.57928 type:complete len:420 (+) Transcript_19683:587-1846(+)
MDEICRPLLPRPSAARRSAPSGSSSGVGGPPSWYWKASISSSESAAAIGCPGLTASRLPASFAGRLRLAPGTLSRRVSSPTLVAPSGTRCAPPGPSAPDATRLRFPPSGRRLPSDEDCCSSERVSEFSTRCSQNSCSQLTCAEMRVTSSEEGGCAASCHILLRAERLDLRACESTRAGSSPSSAPSSSLPPSSGGHSLSAADDDPAVLALALAAALSAALASARAALRAFLVRRDEASTASRTALAILASCSGFRPPVSDPRVTAIAAAVASATSTSASTREARAPLPTALELEASAVGDTTTVEPVSHPSTALASSYPSPLAPCSSLLLLLLLSAPLRPRPRPAPPVPPAPPPPVLVPLALRFLPPPFAARAPFCCWRSFAATCSTRPGASTPCASAGMMADFWRLSFRSSRRRAEFQ